MKILIGAGSLTATVLVKQLPYLRFLVTSQAAGLKPVMEKRDSLTETTLEKESGRASDQ